MARSVRDYTKSEKVNKLTWQAECLFARLLTVADRNGSYYANPDILKSLIFPLRSSSIRNTDMIRWVDEINSAGLIVQYEAEGKALLRIIEYKQELKWEKAKFPNPPPEVEVEDEIEVEREVRTRTHAIPSEDDFLDYCRSILPDYPAYEFSLKAKYQTWVDSGWKTGHNKQIVNWKNTIKNTIPYLNKMNPGINKQVDKITKLHNSGNEVKEYYEQQERNSAKEG